MIRFTHTSKRYPSGFDALQNVSFHMPPGQMAFLTGHSGAGKSSLLKLIALLERSTRGQVLINGQNLAKISRRRIPYFRRNIGIIFQDHQLLFDRTVYDNVALPLIIAGYPRQETGKRVRAALDKVGLLGKERKYPITLSGGEQQRVGIARAVVNKPPLLLADEPTGNLDRKTGETILNLLDRLTHQAGKNLIMVTHSLSSAQSADLVYRLEGGQLVKQP